MVVIEVDHVWKQYSKGTIGSGSFLNSLKTTFHPDQPVALPGNPENDQPVSGKLKQNIQKDKAGFFALEDCCFLVERGESLGIIGKNGAGKSTLLKILSRITAPTAGKVKIKGRVASLLEVGTGFHQDLTGRENIFLNGSMLGMSRKEIRRKMDEIISFSGVEAFIDTPVKRYSSGMYVRLAFSVAAHLDADILLMDEVLAVGDNEFQKKCQGKMDEVTRKGRTILFVSHNLEAVNSLCERTLLLENGKMAALGPTAEVVEQYLQGSDTHTMSRSFPEKGLAVDILQVQLLNRDQEASNYFNGEEPPIVRFTLKINKLEPGAVIGFGLVNRYERRVFTDERPLTSIMATTGTYLLDIDIPVESLVPGRYGLVFAVHIPNQDVITSLEDPLYLFIHHPGTNQYRYNSDEGSLLVRCGWRTANI